MQFLSRLRLAGAILLAWPALTPTEAAAHAIVVASDPAVDAVLHGTKFPVMLRFNSRIDQERSRLTLLRADATSQALPLAPSASPDTLTATLEGVPPGHYRLRWQVLAVDGHITRGDIPFTVAP